MLDVEFQCAPGLLGKVPPPVLAKDGIPKWYRTLPRKRSCPTHPEGISTIKKCVPFLDAIRSGFLIRAMSDVEYRNGEIKFDSVDNCGLPFKFMSSPIGYHDKEQVYGSGIGGGDEILFKFHNPWLIKVPSDYSMLVSHPVGLWRAPFQTISGFVDVGLYSNAFVQFPAVWTALNEGAAVKKGDPIAQCIIVKKHDYQISCREMSQQEYDVTCDSILEILETDGLYRKRFWRGL